MAKQKKALLAILYIFITHVNAFNRHYSSALPQSHLKNGDSKEAENPARSWVDRQACWWFRACGSFAWWNKLSGGVTGHVDQQPLFHEENSSDVWNEGRMRPEDWTDDPRVTHSIPQYVFDYAPLVHLYSEEKFWPCDIAEHLFHVTPNLNYTPIQPRTQSLNLTNLDELNEWSSGRFVYLKSNDNVEQRPDWLGGKKNIPDLPEEPDQQDGNGNNNDEFLQRHEKSEDIYEFYEHKRKAATDFGARSKPSRGKLRPKHETSFKQKSAKKADVGKGFERDTSKAASDEIKMRQLAGRSDAPAVLIVVNKGRGIVDAFWFFFYSYNLGNVVLNVRFGNHVGDWEHTLVRFENGKPRYVYFSEHNFGEAYSYGAVEKIGKRPVVYSATGTHAMYATPGLHPYILPLGILHDQTDRGPLWDPLLNSHTYTYDYLTDDLRASNTTPHAPTQWFYFAGHWGDRHYPLDDDRQYEFVGQYHYVSGPLGPRFKNLGRRKVCQGRYSDPCVIKNWLASSTVKYWEGFGDGEAESASKGERDF